MRTRVIHAQGERRGELERVAWLDPYTAETIGADARRAGPGARLEITVPQRTTAAGIAAVESLFAWLRDKGVEVRIRRGDDDS